MTRGGRALIDSIVFWVVFVSLAMAPNHSLAKAAMIRTLDKIREQLEHDPAWFDDVFRDLPRSGD